MDNAEARTRVLQLYKAWYRHIPTMVNEFDIPVNVAKSRDLLRDKFRSNAHIKDTRVIDMLVVKVCIFEISNNFSLMNQFEQSKMSATASLGRSGVSKMSQNTELSREFALSWEKNT